METEVREGVDRETIETVQAMSGTYKHGWETDIETEYAPKGAVRRYRPADQRQERRAGMDAGMASGGLSPLGQDGRADLGDGSLSGHRLSGPVLLRETEKHGDQAEVAGRSRPQAAGDLCKAGNSAEGTDASGRVSKVRKAERRVAVDAVFDWYRWEPRSRRNWPRPG